MLNFKTVEMTWIDLREYIEFQNLGKEEEILLIKFEDEGITYPKIDEVESWKEYGMYGR